MAFITDIFGTGVVDPANNVALHRLADLLGDNLVFGTSYATNATSTSVTNAISMTGNNGNTLLLLLSSALGPVYLAILFLILAWIAVGGTAKSALDGEFLGRDWSTIGVPASLIASVILLSPVPGVAGGGQGLTLAQVVYVRAIALGSNFGDLILKTAFEAANQRATNNALASDPTGAAKLQAAVYKDVSGRMLQYFSNYLCAEQLIASGVNYQFDFFMQLNTTCKIPAGAQILYQNYYKHTFKILNRNGPTIDSDGNPIYETVSTPPPEMFKTQTAANLNSPAREYTCYYNAFRANYTDPNKIPAELRTAFHLYAVPSIKTPTNYASAFKTAPGAKPVIDDGTKIKQVTIESDAVVAGWMQTLSAAVSCLQSQNIPMRQNAYDWFMGTERMLSPFDNQPWAKGWAMAATFTQDALNNANRAPANDLRHPYQLDSEIVGPDLDAFGKTMGGPLARESLKKLQVEITQGIKPKVEALVQTMSDAVLADTQDGKISATVSPSGQFTDSTHGNYRDTARIIGAASLAGVVTTMSTPGQQAQVISKVSQGFSSGMGTGFLGKLVGGMGGKAVASTAYTIGAPVRYLREAASLMRDGLTARKIAGEIADDAAKGAASSLPFVGALITAGKAVVSAAAKVTNAVFSQPGMAELTFFVLTIINVLTLAPEIAMAIALLLWLLRVAAWFLVIPISVVLLSLPKTNVGHDAWKEGLALAMTPALTMLFFVVSMLMFDVVIDVSFVSIFQPYIAEFQQPGFAKLSGVAGLMFDLFTGELVYRLMAFAGVLTLGTFFAIGLILRGPSWAMQKLGLRNIDLGDHGEFGNVVRSPMGMGR